MKPEHATINPFISSRWVLRAAWNYLLLSGALEDLCVVMAFANIPF